MAWRTYSAGLLAGKLHRIGLCAMVLRKLLAGLLLIAVLTRFLRCLGQKKHSGLFIVIVGNPYRLGGP